MRRVIALAGRPNTGKTTLFNALTGLRQRVANFAGCTVEKAVGAVTLAGEESEVVDLPGTHCLLPDTEDEKVSSASRNAPSPAATCWSCKGRGEQSQTTCPGRGPKAAGYPWPVVNMIEYSSQRHRRDAKPRRVMGMPVSLCRRAARLRAVGTCRAEPARTSRRPSISAARRAAVSMSCRKTPSSPETSPAPPR